MKKFIIIAAIDKNFALGKDNDLVWHLPDDFKRFKDLTTGHHIIMGRKTFESFPKPLPNRKHIIITNQKNYQKENCIVVHSIEEALLLSPENEVTYIIGGGQIYKQALEYASVLELTQINHVFESVDTFFPSFNIDEWLLESSIFHPKDEKHLYDFYFNTYKRK